MNIGELRQMIMNLIVEEGAFVQTFEEADVLSSDCGLVVRTHEHKYNIIIQEVEA